MRRWRLATAAALLAGPLAGPAQADHSWSNYHWPLTAANQQINVRTLFTESYWAPLAANAVSQWDGNDPDRGSYTDYLRPVRVGTATHTTAKRCDPLAGEVIVCSAPYGQRGWLGIASIWASGDHITQGTTKLNETYHNAGTYASATWRALVTCQEIGHDFGLGHQNEDFSTDLTNSCMEYTSLPEGNETPDAHDFQQLAAIYAAHFAEGGGGGGGGGGGTGCNPRSPKCASGALAFRSVGESHPAAPTGTGGGEWGRIVGSDGQGRPNRFELDLGGGHRKITHVTWVPGFRPTRDHFHD